ncbi:hypothetical protein [Aeromonas caviae]
MAASGIKFYECDDINLNQPILKGFETGIEFIDCNNVKINKSRFEDVSTGIKSRRVNGLDVSDCINTKSALFELTVPARLVTWYINELRRKY